MILICMKNNINDSDKKFLLENNWELINPDQMKKEVLHQLCHAVLKMRIFIC